MVYEIFCIKLSQNQKCVESIIGDHCMCVFFCLLYLFSGGCYTNVGCASWPDQYQIQRVITRIDLTLELCEHNCGESFLFMLVKVGKCNLHWRIERGGGVKQIRYGVVNSRSQINMV